MRYGLNLLLLGDDDLKSLNINGNLLRVVMLILCTILIASEVSLSGNIGWVGLVIPHLTRLIVGTNHLKSVPMSFIIGAIFMLIIDSIARSLSESEIPLSILSALIGSPIFIILLKKSLNETARA